MNFYIIYPDERWVSEKQIRGWYSDAKADGRLENPDLTDVVEMAHELGNIGDITLARPRKGASYHD